MTLICTERKVSEVTVTVAKVQALRFFSKEHCFDSQLSIQDMMNENDKNEIQRHAATCNK